MESLGEDFVEKRAETENEFCYQYLFGNKKSIYLLCFGGSIVHT